MRHNLIITMVANDAALEAVVGGDDGFLEKLGHGGIHISMSTISVALARSLATRHQAHGSDWVAAPVFGRPEAAASGKLWILQSGQAEAKERVRVAARTYRRLGLHSSADPAHGR